MECSGRSRPSGISIGVRRLLWVLCALVVCVMGLQAEATETGPAALMIDADYPGGNIVVERLDGDTVYVRPDLRDTQGWWFYWNFRVRGAAGRTIAFDFGSPGPVGVLGPAVSLDSGRSWSWAREDKAGDASFTYAFAKDAEDVRFCFGMPYQEANLREFLAQHQGDPHLRVEELCHTPRGRSVERLHVGRLDGRARFRVLMTARHHACEMMASYVLEGALAAMLAETEDGRWFQRNVEVLAIPFMDKDGVEDGDQGKNRKPRDHNRDYSGASIHPSVAAVRRFVPNWSGGKLLVALDLHCPYLRGPHNEVIYMVGSADAAIWQQQCRFGRILEDVRQGPLVYRASDNLPFGTAWNTGSTFSQGKTFRQWVGELQGVRLATTFEIPYANAGGQAVTAESAAMFGRSLAPAIRRYLEQPGI